MVRGRLISKTNQKLEGIAIVIVETPESIPEIAAISNMEGYFNLPISALGTYCISIQMPYGAIVRKFTLNTLDILLEFEV